MIRAWYGLGLMNSYRDWEKELRICTRFGGLVILRVFNRKFAILLLYLNSKA